MFMNNKVRNKFSLFITASVLIIICIRFIITGLVPFFDKTEARYAEISRLMFETNEWIVLQIDYGIPFWAKPPLSTWLSAFSFEIFGLSEMAARLPSFLIALAILFIVGRMVKKEGFSFYLPAFVLLTMPEFLIHAGVVSTDSALGFSVVLIMLSFWKAMTNEIKTYWNYLFFIAIGLGLLAKGPIVILLTGPPIFIWCILKKDRFKELFSKLPWLIGILISALIAVPWYVLAEKRSPGFIDYFLIGEHFKRFIESGWKGDLYGSGHSQPIGMIWLFLLVFAFPWIQIVLYKLWKNRKVIFKNDWISYLVLWLFWTPFFFTFSGNILHTYIFPVLAPIALLVVYWWNEFKKPQILLAIGSVFPVLVTMAFIIFLTGKVDYNLNTDKYLLQNNSVISGEKETPIFYWKQKSYSGQFYSEGRAQTIQNEMELDSIIHGHDKLLFIIPNKKIVELSQVSKDKLIFLESNFKTSTYIYNTSP